MGYRFCLGPSGSGKSTFLQKEMIRRGNQALDEGDFDSYFLFIVPEQYSMQTQNDLVHAAGKRGGILNVDVLPFNRLEYRVFNEVGTDTKGILDEMGKSLILRKLSLRCEKNLHVLGERMHHPAMIEEVKSLISEFMQYDISPDDVDNMIFYSEQKGRGNLAAKLSDVDVLYRAFVEEKETRFLTGEESLDRLSLAIPKSTRIHNSVIVFDGFTGFTPIQYNVIQSLLITAKECIFVLDYAEDGGTPVLDVMQGKPFEEQDLFTLTRKTVSQICRLASQCGVLKEDDLFIGLTVQDGRFLVEEDTNDHAVRHRAGSALWHLGKHLFRYPVVPYEDNSKELPIHLFLASNPVKEVQQMMICIRKRMAEKGYHYRDFAIVTGDLASYEDELRLYADRYDVPIYIDEKRTIMQNPLPETIRSALLISAGNYQNEAVFRFLRGGLSGLAEDEIDHLENYCLAKGINTRGKWEMAFEGDMEPLRQTVMSDLAPLQDLARSSVRTRTKALYQFLTRLHAGEQIEEKAQHFRDSGHDIEAMEYEQIYRAVIHLLDELYELSGEEMISAQDYQELVDSGLNEIRLGTLPQQVDVVLAGDMERARIGKVKILFFLGVNDGIIPKNGSDGGILSEFERDFLQGSKELTDRGLMLAPSPKEQMVNQKLYLYRNLTKPEEEVYLSWSAAAKDASTLHPSYLIGHLQKLFLNLLVEKPEEEKASSQMIAAKDAAAFLAPMIRDYADGLYLKDQEKLDEFLTLYGYCSQEEVDKEGRIDRLKEAAFARYQPEKVSQETSRKLYGNFILGSARRLETAAQCYLHQYLQYGLRLKEREVYSFAMSDSGTILHESIERFGELLEQENLSWTEYSKEQGKKLVRRALEETAGQYHEQVLYDTARGAYEENRLLRILERTQDTLQYQLQQGDFVPVWMEQEFGKYGELSFNLGDGRRLILTGRIDRVDLAKKDNTIYVKIIDYKSGKHDLNLEQMKEGLQLQLVFYMEAALSKLRVENPHADIEPTALFYYQFDDPMLTGKEAKQVLEKKEENADQDEEEQNETRMVRKKLRPRGYVIGDKEAVSHVDRAVLNNKEESLAAPVTTKMNGEWTAGSHVLSKEEYQDLVQAMKEQVICLARDILEGKADASPVKLDSQRTSCTYCPYQNVCGFDPRIAGYEIRERKGDKNE